MASADRKHHGPGVKGKADGTGAMTDVPADLPENAVLSNGDKSRHSEERGLDSKNVQNEQRRDRAMKRQPDEETGVEDEWHTGS